MNRVKSSYNSRVYDELLITVFADNSEAVDVFRKWFLKNSHILCQEAFAYEINNKMIIEEVK